MIQKYTGVCVVLLPDDPAPFGTIREPHLTLDFLGRVDDFKPTDEARLRDLIRWASTLYRSAHGEVTGTGKFWTKSGDTVDVWLINSLNIDALRWRIRGHLDKDRKQPDQFGFIPHVTSGGEPLPGPFPVRFGRIALWFGPERYVYPLQA